MSSRRHASVRPRTWKVFGRWLLATEPTRLSIDLGIGRSTSCVQRSRPQTADILKFWGEIQCGVPVHSLLTRKRYQGLFPPKEHVGRSPHWWSGQRPEGENQNGLKILNFIELVFLSHMTVPHFLFEVEAPNDAAVEEIQRHSTLLKGECQPHWTYMSLDDKAGSFLQWRHRVYDDDNPAVHENMRTEPHNGRAWKWQENTNT